VVRQSIRRFSVILDLPEVATKDWLAVLRESTK
jgi:hypothetical protein